ncbi:L-rhamnono-gamma-lactonase [Podospora pseudoanserina]|uniref:L-rhamnono-gamma-lactonase n=1 Tax=Podospora pseudoanserina TaxID=2609844 RepID=A0ABR0IFB2_9PEZI|nr:L-rhamnono-gamma-lactonase [Podospora pseudoanserina]
MSIPIIDSHIHLWNEAEAPSHNWYASDSPLATRHSIAEYREATSSSASQLSGFIYIEADRKNDDSKDWSEPLNELAWMRRIIEGKPQEGEGHTADNAKLCLGIIPWAPIASGLPKLKEYIATVEEQAGEAAWAKVKGFRYLLQDKPNKTGLTEEFIDGLKLLGEKGWVFDAGVDQHRRGRVQLEELVEIIDRAHDGVEDEDKKVVFIINHLCKPDLTIISQTDPSFIAWYAHFLDSDE